MSVLIQAGEDAERIAAMFSGLAGLSAELKRVGSLQQAADEAEARLARAKDDDIAAKADLERSVQVTNDRLAEAKANRDRIIAEIADIRTTAEADFAVKRLDGERLIERAEAQAAGIEAVAKRRAEEIVVAAKAEAAPYEQQIADGRAQLEQIIAEAVAAEGRREAAEAEIDRLKNLFAR